MTGRDLLLIVVALGIFPALAITHQRGYEKGYAAAESKADKAAITALTSGLQQYRDQAAEHQALIEASQHASTLVRRAADDAAHYNRSTTNDLRKLLADTAAERAECRFDDGVMQQLGAARDRAAAAAAGAAPSGTARELSGTGDDADTGG